MRRLAWAVVALGLLALAGCTSVRESFTLAVSAVPNQGVPPLLVHFTAQIHGGTPPYLVTWDFGDGTEGEGVEVDHEYVEFGEYDVLCEVIDADGRNLHAWAKVRLIDHPPLLSVEWSPETPEAWEPVTFVAHASDPDGGPVDILWDFGDGYTGYGEVVTHRFPGPGCGRDVPEFVDYIVTCTATDDEGNETVVTETVTVFKKCDG